MSPESMIIARGTRLEINDGQDYIHAVDFLKGCKQLEKTIVEHFRGTKANPGPLVKAHELHKDLVRQEKEKLDPLQRIMARIQGLILGWEKMQERLAGVSEIPEVDDKFNRSTWHAEIVDESLIPREYLVPDMKKLNEAARRMRNLMAVPGVKSVEDQSVVVR